MTVFITGGVKNGKSSLAQQLALKLADKGKHYYVATMIPSDQEDYNRIAHHLEDRKGMGFETIECGRDILSVLDRADRDGTFLLDSVTALVLNELFPDPTSCEMDLDAAKRCAKDMEIFVKSVNHAVIVSDFIYSDAERYDSVTETYRKCLAQVDCVLAQSCSTVIEVTAGNCVIHKGGMPK